MNTTTEMVTNMISSTQNTFSTIGAPVLQIFLSIFLLIFAFGIFNKYLLGGIRRAGIKH